MTLSNLLGSCYRGDLKQRASGLVFQMLVLMAAGWLQQCDLLIIDYLREENRVLREQLGGRRLRLTNEQRRRLAVRAEPVGRALLSGLATLVTPKTLLRWYRELVARKYDGSGHRRAGRPPTEAEVAAALVLQMARENPTWGYTRIRGALHNLGHALARSTIQSILADGGLEPAPERRTRGSWAPFLKAQWGAVAATDFFSVEVLTWAGVVRYHVFFVIELKTRAVQVAGITHDLHQAWVVQAARGLLDAVDGFLKDARFLIHDRDPVFCKAFSRLLKSGGVRGVRLPSRSPNLNAFAERFVGSIRRECLSRVIPLGERHLRVLVAEYVEHYNLERNHQGVGNRLLGPALAAPANDVGGAVRRRERLGGLLSFYHRGAA